MKDTNELELLTVAVLVQIPILIHTMNSVKHRTNDLVEGTAASIVKFPVPRKNISLFQ